MLRPDRVVRSGRDRGQLLVGAVVVPRSVLAGSTIAAARALIGVRLVRDDVTGRRAGRIVEVEAYLGPDDRASHARFGMTPRNRIMYGPAGRAYVYLVYGMYDCLNVVTGADEFPAAVLIRAISIQEGEAQVRVDRILKATTRRRQDPDRAAAAAARIAASPTERLASGPGLVAAAFGIDTRWTGLDLCDPASSLRLEVRPAGEAPPRIRTGPRVGIDFAGPPWTDRPWRFQETGHPSVSGPAGRR